MIAELILNTAIVIAVIITVLVVGSFAVGLVLTVIDSTLETRDELKYRKHTAIEGRRMRKEQRVRHIKELEEELGIGEKQ